MPDYVCTQCGRKYNWYDGRIRNINRYRYCENCDVELTNLKDISSQAVIPNYVPPKPSGGSSSGTVLLLLVIIIMIN